MHQISTHDLHEAVNRIQLDVRSKLLTMPPDTQTWWDSEYQELIKEVLTNALPIIGIEVVSTSSINNSFRLVSDKEALGNFITGADEWEIDHPKKRLGKFDGD